MTLLDPDDRDLYTDLLRPPPGMAFDAGVGATYSLDLDTLLTVPLHLFLYAGDGVEEEALGSGVAVLDGLRRVASRLRLYGQRGRIQEPRGERPLYTLLERVAVEVEPPSGQGSFHPKFWVLRFRDGERDRTRLRLMVLSRNVTRDPSWDLVLQLDGTPGEEKREGNGPLARLVRRLPSMATGRSEPSGDGPDVRALADDLDRTRWELPGGFDRVHFHTTGVDDRSWLPSESDRLMVVSPFCTERALRALADTTSDPEVLVSRPEELLELNRSAPGAFRDVYVLDDMVEQVEGEEVAPDLRGLHAKLYLTEGAGRTRLHLGSANATGAALLGGGNVEVVAELAGDTDEVGGIDDVMDADGLRGLLQRWTPPDEPPEVDEDARRAERQLEAARDALARAGLSLRCERSEGDDRWRLVLVATEPPDLAGIEILRAWPVTLSRDRAVDAAPLAEGEAVQLEARALSSLTTFVAFRLEAEAADEGVTFVLNLPVEGLPREERDAAVVRGIVRDRESFLRYLLLLLGEIDPEDALGPGEDALGAGQGGWGRVVDELPLLEELTRAYCRDPGRLEDVRDLLEDLEALGPGATTDADGERVVPEAFLEVWGTFEAALEEDGA